tara:strand:- start:8869 stop:9546 length:678 start_codon:yes stop_codon:yes gene_type:complete
MFFKYLAYNNQKVFWNNKRERRKPDHPVIQAFVEPKIRCIEETIKKRSLSKRLSLLDIGCGNGFFTYYFERIYDTTALDFSIYMLKNNHCHKRIYGSATTLPFSDGSFDITFCSNLLHHLDNHEDAVLEMKRVSRKYLVLSEPNRNNPLMFLFGLLKKEERGTIRFSLEYMKKLMNTAGLNLILITSIGAILPNKTPKFALPVLKKFDSQFPCAFYNIAISEKIK